jgi:hypothetical protein
MGIQSRITIVAARIRDRLSGRTDQPDKAWENEQREQAAVEVRHPSASAHIERLADVQNDPTMQGYLVRPSRGEERTRSTFEERNPEAHALINRIAAIVNDRTMDGPAADRAINTLMTEHQRQKLGIVDRGDVYGLTVHDQRGARSPELTHTRDFDRATARKRETIRSLGKARDDRDFGIGD